MRPAAATTTVTSSGSDGIGALLRWWRAIRRMSQLDLASAAMTTPRYVSFVETGRAQPSRQMVVRLARALEVPLRERNGLLLAAGYAPLYRQSGLEAPELARVETALASMLAQHEPFPAVVMDRGWNIVRVNGGARRLFSALFAPAPLPDEANNVLRLMIEPGPVRDHVANWPDVVVSLLERARREAVGGVLDADTAALVERLQARPDVAAVTTSAPETPTAPVIDVRFALDGATLGFFSVISTLGTPTDITAQELRVESFFPTDDTTRQTWTARSD